MQLIPSYLSWLSLLICLVTASIFFRRVGKSRKNLVVSVLRSLSLSLLVLSLFNPTLTKKAPPGLPVILFDVSKSITPEMGNDLLDETRRLTSGMETVVIPFAGKSGKALNVIPSEVNSLITLNRTLDPDHSNIGNALEAARLINPSAVIIASDGLENAGDAASVVDPARGWLAPIFSILPHNGSSRRPPHVEGFEAPTKAAIEKKVTWRAVVVNSSETAMNGKITVTQGTEKIFEQEIELATGTEKIIGGDSATIHDGENILTVVFEYRKSDGSTGRETQRLFITGEGREAILLINGGQEEDRFLSSILKEQSYKVDIFTNTQGEVDEYLSKYRTIILNNAPAEAIPLETLRHFRKFVEQGGNIIASGGSKSFGLGGYIGSPLESLLPVLLVSPQAAKARLNIAVNLVIDQSRSMATDNKLEFAKTAATEVVRNLKEDDFIGVTGFNYAPFVALPISQVSQARAIAFERIGRLFATGKTNLFPAIDEARRALVQVKSGRKHMIILTDGKVPDGGPYYIELTKQIRGMGVTISTVLLGSGVEDALLREMAEVGGGSFYQTADPNSLPKIFLSDIKVTSGEQTLKERVEYSVQKGPQGILSTTIKDFPNILGYVQTRPREDANLELVALGEGKADPLLASWNVGRGKVTAFTSDTNGRWSANWVTWDSFAKFWTELISGNKSTGKNQLPRFDLMQFIDGNDLVLDLTVWGDNEPNSIGLNLKLPDGTNRSLQVTRLAPGHYQARLKQPHAGKYSAVFSADGSSASPIFFEISESSIGENSFSSPNITLLRELAEKSGGEINPTKISYPQGEKGLGERTSISWWFLLGALILFLAELAYLAELQRKFIPKKSK